MTQSLKWGVVIPAFREQARVAEVVHAVRKQGGVALVVDDGSDDGTAERAASAGAVVLRLPVNQGKGAALAAGFKEAQRHGFDVVLTMDADGQHDPAELPRFLETYQRTGIPVLVGSRRSSWQEMPLVRRLTNRFMSRLLSQWMGHYMPDTQCGYRLYRNDLLPLLATVSTGYAAESEVLLRLAARGIRMDVVSVRTLYGDQRSKIRPLVDACRFVGMLARYRAESRGLIKSRARPAS